MPCELTVGPLQHPVVMGDSEDREVGYVQNFGLAFSQRGNGDKSKEIQVFLHLNIYYKSIM